VLGTDELKYISLFENSMIAAAAFITAWVLAAKLKVMRHVTATSYVPHDPAVERSLYFLLMIALGILIRVGYWVLQLWLAEPGNMYAAEAHNVKNFVYVPAVALIVCGTIGLMTELTLASHRWARRVFALVVATSGLIVLTKWMWHP
jgi:hypothetical protein